METIDDIFAYLRYCKNQDTFSFETRDRAERFAERLKEVLTNECFDRLPVVVVDRCSVVVYLPKSMQEYKLPATRPEPVPATKKPVRSGNEPIDEAEALFKELDEGNRPGPSAPEA